MYCKHCGEPLLPGDDRCADCGWAARAAKPAAEKQRQRDRRQCDFTAGPRRCPLVGTTALGGYLLCCFHLACRLDPAAGVRVLDDIDRHGPPRLPTPREDRIQAHIAQHDLHRRNDESLSEFRKRCMIAAVANIKPDAPRVTRAQRIDALAERLAERIAIGEADGLDADQSIRSAVQAHAEELLPG